MEAMGHLAAGVAHDFNNLLTVIVGYSDLALERVDQEGQLATELTVIHEAVEWGRDLTAQLLAFGRAQVLQPQVLDLNVIVAEAERMLRRIILENIHFEVAMDPTLDSVRVDPGQMHQVLINLAINARDSMPNGGTLRITTTNAIASVGDLLPGIAPSPQRCVAIMVSDTGCGMAPEVKLRVFEPFFTTKAPGKGTGLGLSMVYGVVAESGGRVAVESALDQGTTFTIHVPSAERAEKDQKTAAVRQGQLGGGETILLVEDEPSIRVLVRKVLARYGYDVLEASDVNHALDIAECHPAPIHLLLSDVLMPQLSGHDLARRIVQHRSDIRVLYMSGCANRLDPFEMSTEPGMVLAKPFTPERLAFSVRECLSR